MTLPLDHLTEAELGVLEKHRNVITQWIALVQTRQEAVNDIVGLVLEARGFSPETHQIQLPEGIIVEKPKEPPKP